MRLAVLCSVFLAVFALYAGAVRLMPFHDDAVLMPAINNRTLVTIFENRPYGDGHHRPLSYVPWLLTRDLFGWFIPPVLHMWNVWAHVLNTALVAALAAGLGRSFGMQQRAILLPAMAALMFGFAPLSYEAVLWASALVHPLMVTFGLAALNTYLIAQHHSRFRNVLLMSCWMLLLAACLSHEMGFVFGALLLVIECALAVRYKRRPCLFAFVLFGVTLVYALGYRFVLITKWTDPASRDYARSPVEVLANLVYQAQNFVSWQVILLRRPMDWIAQSFGIRDVQALIAGSFVAGVVLALVLLRRARSLALGLLGPALWAVTIAPSSLLLTQDYVWSSPRMTYAPSIGVALFWGVVVVVVGEALRRRFNRMGQVALGAFVFVLCGWSVVYVAARLNETARLTPALRAMDAALRASDPADRLLLINSSFVNFATQPAFLIGREGMPIWQYGYKVADGPMWAWPAAVSGVVRQTANVRHAASLTDRNPDANGDFYFTTGETFYYGVFGDEVDDVALRQNVLQSHLVFRFQYDAPGFRALRLAHIRPQPAHAQVDGASARALARLELEGAGVTIADARAWTCDNRIYLDVTWRDVQGIVRPAGVFVHGYDASGQRVIVADRDPVGGALPLDQFPAHISLTETREIVVPSPELEALRVRELRIGVYARASGRRFTALRTDGSTWDEDAVVLPIEVSSPTVQSAPCP